jgi:integrase
MASVYRDSARDGYRVQVVVRGVRRKLWLGKIPRSAAKEIAAHLERLKTAAETATAPPADSLRWAAAVDRRIRAQLGNWGLVALGTGTDLPRSVNAFATHYAAQIGGAASTKKRWANVIKKLTGLLPPGTALAAVSPGDADRIAKTLRSQHAPSHAGKLIGDLKQLFESAVRSQLIGSNPFIGLDTRGTHQAARESYVTPADCLAVAAVADPTLAALIALARFSGLRVPSEPLALEWQHIDWAGNRFSFNSPKTGLRTVPIFPEIRPHLDKLWAAAPEGAVWVFPRGRKSAATTWRAALLLAIARAGLQPWPKLWQNLRASCRTDLESQFPAPVCDAWLGHSSRIAAKHYSRLHDGHYQAAVGYLFPNCGVTGGVTGPSLPVATRQPTNEKTPETP